MCVEQRYIKCIPVSLPSGYMVLEQRRNLVEIRSLRCSKLNIDIVPTYSALWVVYSQYRICMLYST